jgi:hypothetical protein
MITLSTGDERSFVRVHAGVYYSDQSVAERAI